MLLIVVLENPAGTVTHLQLSPPPQLCFSLCPVPTVAMKTPCSHFYSGRLSVFQTLNSARKKCCLSIKKLTSVQGRKKKVKILGGIKITSGETDFYVTAKQRGNAMCSCKYIRND